MRARFLMLALAGFLAAGLVAPAFADPSDLIEPPKNLPKVPSRGDRLHSLDFLFGALKAAPDDETAKAIEHRIWAVWMVTRSDTANLLMTRVRKAIEDKDLDLALTLLDAIVKIKPDYVEAWNRRATVYFMKNEYGKSLADVREVLKREPRHFGALSGLGLILQDVGNDKLALEAYRRAVAVYPRLQRIPDLVKTLSEKVDVRDI